MRKTNLNLKRELELQNERFEGSDSFLGKDVLTLANKINSSRNIMFNSHLEQSVVLKEPDFPRVFTNYENEVGRYSSSYFKSKKNQKIIAKIAKFSKYPDRSYVLVVKGDDGEYDIIERKLGEKLTEGYCYLNVNDNIDSKKKGDTIKQDEVLFHSTSFDSDMNYRYGINAKTLYLIENNTIEDAIWCSESFKKRMTSYYMEEVEVNINNNDILCNLYGTDKDEYKAFPNIGEHTDNQILVSRRRINYEHALFDLQNENLKNVNYNVDTVFYSDGQLIDIDIFCNQDIEKIEKYFYNKQIVDYLKMQNQYYESIVKVLEPIIEGKNKYTENLSYLYRRAKDVLNPEVQWKNDKSDFDNIVIVFRILHENTLHDGSKVTGRFGNKGVISKFVPDDQMPVTEYGDRVDIVLNALGVVNRLNPAQLYELELNFISDNIVRKMKETKSLTDKAKMLFDYIMLVNENQAREMMKYFKGLDKQGKINFIKETEEKGIYLHQPPFWGNVTFDKLSQIYDYYPWIEPYKVYINGKEMRNRLVIGDEYILKMKHEPKGKFSTRSTSYVNMKGIPSKSLNYKKNQILYSTTPIRLGEMEIDNLLLTQDPDEVVRMASMYSSSEANRHELIEQLLTEDILNLEEVELDDPTDNHNREILDVYLKSLGLKLTKVEEAY
jgi:DNA-directed RNA polymerase beta subunit